ncbi:MAG: hypothetical protein K6U88_15905, partial [Dehalococcoidia bacterium]|nr:hypothetical protein [Dehalococcoidia bacterium]
GDEGMQSVQVLEHTFLSGYWGKVTKVILDGFVNHDPPAACTGCELIPVTVKVLAIGAPSRSSAKRRYEIAWRLRGDIT